MDGENAIIVRNLVKHYEGFTLNKKYHHQGYFRSHSC